MRCFLRLSENSKANVNLEKFIPKCISNPNELIK